MKIDKCRWATETNNIKICCCGYSEHIGLSVNEEDCEKCEDFYSVIESENERKVDNDTGEIL